MAEQQPTLAELTERAKNRFRERCYEQFKTSEGCSVQLDQKDRHELEDAFIREKHPDATVKTEEALRQWKQLEADLPAKRAELQKQMDDLGKEVEAKQKEWSQLFRSARQLREEVYPPIFAELSAERKLKIKQGTWKKPESEKKQTKRMKSSD
jgi:hypothetical protein